jgi:glyoxylate/hydroxypyruvate reductase A
MATKSIAVFYSDCDDFVTWKGLIESACPEVELCTADQVRDAAKVKFALVWQPPQDFFSRFSNMELVVNLGAGVDSLVSRSDLPAGVAISRLGDQGMAALMASYVVYGVTKYARDFPAMERAQQERRWQYIHPKPLHMITVGLLGLGTLGAAAADVLRGLGFEVHAWTRSPRDKPGISVFSGSEQLENFLSGLDMLVVMLPLTPQTRGLIGERELAVLPQGAQLINVSRGAVVQEPALVDALRSGHLAAAMLDVFEVEPLPPEHPFWDMPNVTITAHLASIAVPEKAAKDVAEEMSRVLKGLPPLRKVDVESGY